MPAYLCSVLLVRNVVTLATTHKHYSQTFFTIRYVDPPFQFRSFSYQKLWQYSNRAPPPVTGASNADGVRQNRDLRPISRFVSQIKQDMAIVIMGHQ